MDPTEDQCFKSFFAVHHEIQINQNLKQIEKPLPEIWVWIKMSCITIFDFITSIFKKF